MLKNSKGETEPSLKHLKRYLQRGDLSEIAAEVGISTWQASQVLAGRARNFHFLTKLIERVEQNKALYKKAQGI